MNVIERKFQPLNSKTQMKRVHSYILDDSHILRWCYKVVVYPLTLLLSAIHAMEQALADFAAGKLPTNGMADFAHLRDIVGFPEYYELEERYKS